MRAKRLQLTLIVILSILNVLKAQQGEPEVILNSEVSDILSPGIEYINGKPTIDGVLDNGLSTLENRKFSIVLKMDKSNPLDDLDYKIAYNHSFLYLFIEMDTEELIVRDRGYQNGDGFLLLLNSPKENMRISDEYFLLAFNPLNVSEDEYFKVIWGKNQQWPFKRLSNETQFKVASNNGKTGFELLLPWSDVYPLHPWAMDKMGMNLLFIKAIGNEQMNINAMVMREDISPEENIFLHTEIEFEKPEKLEWMNLITEKNFNESDSLELKIISSSNKKTKDDILIKIKNSNGEVVYNSSIKIDIAEGENYNLYNIKPAIKSGDYTLEWNSLDYDFSGSYRINIMPEFDFTETTNKLESSRSKISEGSYSSLKLYIQEMAKQITQLDKYEIYPKYLTELEGVIELMNAAEKGNDILATKTGVLRRAYYADDKILPYSIRIPDNYNPNKKFPLIVFLHGSEVDDRTLIHQRNYLFNDNYIIIAPHGRGARNAYATEESQNDIANAIDDACKNYNINTDCIILTGFSMGGYGVYRTYYETPEKFKAIAVLSGPPNLANEYFPNQTHPNFMKENDLQKFSSVPVFIFQGMKDRNAAYEQVKVTIDKLSEINKNLLTVIDENAGHDAPNKENTEKFQEWLNKQL